MDTSSDTPASVSFGRFQISPHRREFLADGRPVQIGGRAFDVLMALIDAQGSVVSKRALMERVWPDRIVEENNLQIQISALRAAFGADRDLIRTVAGRGYQFTGESALLQRARIDAVVRPRWTARRLCRRGTCRSLSRSLLAAMTSYARS